MLTNKQIYLDSRFRTSDSKSNSDFKIDLGNSYYMPNNTSFYMDDVNIPNTWFSVEQGQNSKMYVRYVDLGKNHGLKDFKADIPSNVYNGDTFIAAVKTDFEVEAPGKFRITCDPNRNTN